MKNLKTNAVSFAQAKLKAIIAITIIATLGSCVINVPDDKDGTPNLSLNGVWDSVSWDGDTVIISGSSGKGDDGVTYWRNLTSTGYLTWSGQWRNNANTWTGGTWTLSPDGKTLVVGNANGSSTWRRR
jgi:hypothetical protein